MCGWMGGFCRGPQSQGQQGWAPWAERGLTAQSGVGGGLAEGLPSEFQLWDIQEQESWSYPRPVPARFGQDAILYIGDPLLRAFSPQVPPLDTEA